MKYYRDFNKGVIISLMIFTWLSFAFICHAQDNKMANEILVYINKHRGEKGLSKLQMDAFISEIAEKHSRQMANGTVPFGHKGFDKRVKTISKHIDHINGFAENVAYGNIGAKEVVQMWLGSKGHRKNIEGNYKLTGIGIAATRDGTLYFTQIFIMNR
jgi:uncharacterized protein YkwD